MVHVADPTADENISSLIPQTLLHHRHFRLPISRRGRTSRDLADKTEYSRPLRTGVWLHLIQNPMVLRAFMTTAQSVCSPEARTLGGRSYQAVGNTTVLLGQVDEVVKVEMRLASLFRHDLSWCFSRVSDTSLLLQLFYLNNLVLTVLQDRPLDLNVLARH